MSYEYVDFDARMDEVRSNFETLINYNVWNINVKFVNHIKDTDFKKIRILNEIERWYL